MSSSVPVRRAFVHIGLQKTGTSYLQSHLWDSPQALGGLGVRMVPDNRGQAFHLMRAVRGRLVEGVHPAHAFRSLETLTATVASANEPTLILSQESLAAATADQAARLMDCFGDRELHLVLTVRDIARQLPSLWQQKVKSSRDLSFPDFLEQLTGGTGVAAAVWAQQDLVGILDRWAPTVPAEHVHVVTVPPPGSGIDLLAQRFGAVTGVDFSRLTATDLRRNISLDQAQTELVRRVNDVQQVDAKSQQARMIKQFFAAQVLAPHRRDPARTPEDLRDWCLGVAEKQVAALEARDVAVAGDLTDLLPGDDCFGPPVTQVSEEAVVEAAVDAIAELLVQHAQARRTLIERDRSAGEQDLTSAGTSAGTATGTGAGTAATRLRSLAGRWSRRRSR